MTLRLPGLALLFAVLLPFSIVSAGQNSKVKCSINEDRVWVYDSPATMNVAAKLKCGDPVTVLSRESGFIKVQTADGTQGYVPDENLPAVAPTAVAQPNVSAPPTLASAARAAAAARSASMTPTKPRGGPSTTHVVAAAKASAVPQPTPAESHLATQAPGNAPSLAPPTSASRTEGPAVSLITSSHAKSKQRVKSSSSTVAPPAGQTTPRVLAASSSSSSALAATASPDLRVDSSSMIPVATKPAAVRNVSDAASDDEAEDESYLVRPTSESDDPACRLFFSGYGLSPGQFRWIVLNRKKEFPSVCPAASPSMVDYVIIFTHDADSYSYNMPEPVHVAGGFSDWNPIVQYDMSIVPRSEIDRSKREYVWVFHVKRGTYDPSRFSPHRRFQFSKIESKYSRTLRDAFEFIEAQPVNR
jgi:uncharacterized protein YgiM (DUF1202 family)